VKKDNLWGRIEEKRKSLLSGQTGCHGASETLIKANRTGGDPTR
jgi:hypothetical protein